MRFKRPQVRYADTPQPATPYQSAAQVWDERIGSARVQAKNWRFMAFGCLALALLMAGGLVWRSAQSIVTPYVIEVDQSGQVRAVGEAATPYRPADAQIAHHLARFVTLVRSLSIDPIVVRQNWLDAYDYTTDKGAAVLNDYASKNDPFARIGKESVTVQITSVVRASDTSFNVRWTEQRFVNGAPAGTERWNAVLSTVLQTPRTEQRLRRAGLVWRPLSTAPPAPDPLAAFDVDALIKAGNSAATESAGGDAASRSAMSASVAPLRAGGAAPGTESASLTASQWAFSTSQVSSSSSRRVTNRDIRSRTDDSSRRSVA